MKIAGMHHVALRSHDPERARRFYQNVVGLDFMEIPVSGDITSIWQGAPAEGVLLAAQVGTTLLVIMPPLEGTPGDDRFSEYRIGLDHLAFGFEDRADLDALVERLVAAGVETRGVETDVVGKEYVVFRDPDNVQWEAYLT
jgi:glyoxylase I family protein